jgi:hypothetical protein
MQSMYYIGVDVHKRTISYCVNDGSGAIHAEGTLPATRFDLDPWMKTLPQPWTAAMKATVFTAGSTITCNRISPPPAPIRDCPISIIPSATRSLSSPTAAVFVWAAKNQFQHGFCGPGGRHQRSSR